MEKQNKIYMAGKIEKNCWRHDIFNGLRNSGIWNKLILDADNTTNLNIINENMIYVGPYFFCWLDNKEAYGTLFELGVAYEKKKFIFLAIDKKLPKDFWFIEKASNKQNYYNNVQEAWTDFVNTVSPIDKNIASEFIKTISELKELEKADYEDMLKTTPMSKVIRYFKRNNNITKDLKKLYDGKCQVLNCGYTFRKENGENYSEIHHLLELYKYRIDEPRVMVCVCPNHHKVLHFGSAEEKDKIKIEYKKEHYNILNVGDENGSK